MKMEPIQVTGQGKTFTVLSASIEGRTVILNGRFLKVASIKDGDVVEGEPVSDPQAFMKALRALSPRADLFTFTQRLPDTTAKFSFPHEMDNVAAIPITTHEEWWTNRVKDKTRNLVRKAEKKGVSVRYVDLDDALVRGIKGIYDESPIRQGRRFWHYGKDFETVKRELSTYQDRARFIGAYFEDQLIGFMKVVRVDHCATLFHFLSLFEHRNKSPMNALMSKAVEYCCEEGIGYLLYGRFTYGNKKSSPLADFKKHNGFEEIELPLYYIPLTLKGRLAARLKLYRGLSGILPPKVVETLVGWRARVLSWKKGHPGTPGGSPAEKPVASPNATTPSGSKGA